METTITKTTEHFILADDAKALIETNNKGTAYASLVSKEELMDLLDQDDCDGVNIYINIDSIPSETNAVVVGVNPKIGELTTKIIGLVPRIPPFEGWFGRLFSLS